MRTRISLLGLLLAVATAVSAEAIKQYITLDGTRLLAKPTAFGKTYGKLKKGTSVWTELGSGGYLKVRVEPGSGNALAQVTGYIHKNAVQKNRPRILAKGESSKDASAEEVAAATKGFNKQVEAEYAKGNATLDYPKLDTLIERSRVADPASSNESFRQSGKLGEFSEAAQ